MELKNFQVEFENFGKEHTLRFDSKFHSLYSNFIRLSPENYISFIELIDICEPQTKLNDIEGAKINYAEISQVNGFGEVKPIEVEITDVERKDTEEIRLLKKIRQGDIIKPEKGSILLSSVRPYLKKFVLIDDINSDFYFTKAFITIKPKKVNALLLYHLLRSIFLENIIGINREGKGYPTIKTNDFRYIYFERKQIKNLIKNSDLLLKKIKEIESQINELKKELISLQQVIDKIFIKYKIKAEIEKEKNEFEVFQTNLDNISHQKFLRNGPLYRLFWDVYDGLLFFQEKSIYPIVKLGNLIKLHKTKILKKGILEQEYILLDLEDIESLKGRIINEDKVVTEIGSDKTLFGDSDIIISKIDPYLGYTFLNDPSKPYIGTTELLPFKVKIEKGTPEFIKYLLLSSDYIEKSGFLMYGKRHPRIHILDLLNIKVPCPDLSIQRKIVNEISEIENKNLEAKQKINNLRNKIEDILIQTIKK